MNIEKIKCLKCKSSNIEVIAEKCVITDGWRKLRCKNCNHKWEEGNKSLRIQKGGFK